MNENDLRAYYSSNEEDGNYSGKHIRRKLMPNPRGLEETDLYKSYLDFVLSRKAMAVKERTLVFYDITAGRLVRWMVENKLVEPKDISAKVIRLYLNEFVERKAKLSYIHGQARAIRTFAKFLYEEKYIEEPIKFKMPPSGVKLALPHLSIEQVEKILDACQDVRETALILLMVDSGLRRAEVISLNWEDFDIRSGILLIKRGKGDKSRSVVVGIKTRRALLAYRRTVDARAQRIAKHLNREASDLIECSPLIQTDLGNRFTLYGFRSIILRISERAGIDFSPHALRRTFATLSLKAGMSPLHLQGLLGHSTLEMTRRYTQMVDDDLVEAHRKHGPIDNFIK